MKRALVVGIDHYPTLPLKGCVNDAQNILQLLARNEDESVNFECVALCSSPSQQITRSSLKERITELFCHAADVALFYFSGHGTSNNLGGYIVTQDAKRFDEGVSMADILQLANDSPVRECVILLDCCHSGHFGNIPSKNKVMIREGISILTAARSNQSAMESDGKGLFTSLVCDALRGGAADLLGAITTASIYAHVEPIFGAWDQRPMFKTHVSKSTAIRQCRPLLDLTVVRNLKKYFPEATASFSLDPSFEPDAEPKGHPNENIFADLQKCRANRLVQPDGEEHMYFAAMNRKSCSLTPLGQFYWHLVNASRV